MAASDVAFVSAITNRDVEKTVGAESEAAAVVIEPRFYRLEQDFSEAGSTWERSSSRT